MTNRAALALVAALLVTAAAKPPGDLARPAALPAARRPRVRTQRAA